MYIHANIEILNWESNFFNCKTAKLHFASDAPLISLTQLSSYDIVQAKIASNNAKLIDTMATMGFLFVEGEIDFCLRIDDVVKNHGLDLVLAVKNDIEALKNIAGSAFLHSRFRSPWYRLVDNSRFYSVWVEKAVKGTFDNVCLLSKGMFGNIQGFITVRKLLAKRDARIGLMATSATNHRKEVGKQLIEAVCKWCCQQEIDKLRIATQISNIGAIRLYSQMGAQIERIDYWLYRGRHDSI
ncbi:MAG: dTDP-4-amino-4,6-dideoxy-D-galactose acyltransferase [Arsenophonus sp.]